MGALDEFLTRVPSEASEPGVIPRRATKTCAIIWELLRPLKSAPLKKAPSPTG